MENKQVGPFLISSRLGSNRRQRVFRATQTEQDREVALKFIRIPDSIERHKSIEKIQIEVDVLKRLRHPNLVRIYGAGIHEDEIFFAYELIDGESLTSLLSRRGKFAPDQVVDFGSQIGNLLDYLHDQNIIHSKLTPDKVLIDSEGKIKIADLRLNRSKKRRWDSVRKRELDIAAYMAPEQLTQWATPKSDFYSLGVILYEMLTGKLPYEPDTIARMTRKKLQTTAPSVASHVMNCPVWLDKTVCQMISSDPKKRPYSAQAIVIAFNELRAMDETRESSVSHVKKGFNPLTVGADRKEADKLLGLKEKWQFDPSIFQSTFSIVIGLLLTLAIIAFSVWPLSDEQKLEQAKTLVGSDVNSDWREAREILSEIMANESSSYFDEAQELYFESRRRTLIAQAKRGRILGLQSENTQDFIRAYQLQEEGDFVQAAAIYRQLTLQVDDQGDERHINAESHSRLKLCEIQVEKESNENTNESTDAPSQKNSDNTDSEPRDKSTD